MLGQLQSLQKQAQEINRTGKGRDLEQLMLIDDDLRKSIDKFSDLYYRRSLLSGEIGFERMKLETILKAMKTELPYEFETKSGKFVADYDCGFFKVLRKGKK